MNEPRQRAARAVVAGLVVAGVFGLNSACDVAPAASRVQTGVAVAQTGVSVGQTAVGAAQTALPGLQTSLPGLQATAQAGATLVAAVLSDPQAINAQLQVVLAGASVVVKPTPPGAANEAVTELAVTGTDTRNSLAQMDPSARQATAGAALRLVGQYYPNAAITLTLVDSKGGPLLSGTKAPGKDPAFQ